MIQTSEWVSLGHPDKVADYISSYLLDRFLEYDRNVRFAVEVQIKDEFVSLAGEVTSTVAFPDEQIAAFVREAVLNVGYTRSYRDHWGAENTICGEDLEVVQHISQQSPDIALGVDRDGWGDQGIFWGMAVDNPLTDDMPPDWAMARAIGFHLFGHPFCGLDIKTQVTYADGTIRRVIVAAPARSERDQAEVEKSVRSIVSTGEVIVNGTGRYVVHGPVGDCGTTGRKLAVDFYGGNCVIGGGSPWTKDGTKADVALNLYARHRARKMMAEGHYALVRCAISCCIGRPEIELAFFNSRGETIAESRERKSPRQIVDFLRLREPGFANMCANGLFSRLPDPETAVEP